MDKRTLKSIIIGLKESDKSITYQKISNILASRYGVHMTRQAVNGMYKRAMTDKEVIHRKELILATNDIIVYYLLGYSNRQIKGILADANQDVSIGDIDYIISNNSEHIVEVERTIIDKIVRGLSRGQTLIDIGEAIQYNGKHATKIQLKRLIRKAAQTLLLRSNVKILSDIYNSVGDKQLVKEIIDDNGIEISIKDIECNEYESMYVDD